MPINPNLGLTASLEYVNSRAEVLNEQGPGYLNPELFYSRQLLDTIRIPPEDCLYYQLATEMPIGDKADQLVVRRFTPLEAHSVPLMEGIPPTGDKFAMEKYSIPALQYGRYMEFTDVIQFHSVDPLVTIYTRQYAEVMIKTLDVLAKEAIFAVASKFYAGGIPNIDALEGTVAAADLDEFLDNLKPSMQDLRLIVLSLKKRLVNPRSGGNYLVIASADFYDDMWDDPTVEQYMRFNKNTHPMSDNATVKLVPGMFGMDYRETLLAPVSAEYISGGVPTRMTYTTAAGTGAVTFKAIKEGTADVSVTVVNGYGKDPRTGFDTNYIPGQKIWEYTDADRHEFKASFALIAGADTVVRTGLQGEGQAKMIVKALGSSGVLDPLDQRSSIGFKLNSVAFGSTRPEGLVAYISWPSTLNAI
jgi:N4-gp56 family major capsid protein